jgi:hypothetical protein
VRSTWRDEPDRRAWDRSGTLPFAWRPCVGGLIGHHTAPGPARPVDSVAAALNQPSSPHGRSDRQTALTEMASVTTVRTSRPGLAWRQPKNPVHMGVAA